MRSLTIGRQSAGFVARGHPWVRIDRFTRGLDLLSTGEAVTLVDDRGRGLASALVDRDHPQICARVYHSAPGKDFDPAALVERAWQLRSALNDDPRTTAYRLIHGEADHCPGLRAERYGTDAVLVVFAACALPHAEAVARALAQHLPGRIFIREHLDDLRRRGTAARALDGAALDPEAEVVVRESGVAAHCQLQAGLATGLYVDQRGTRDWLAGRATGWRILNCFAYTGMFSCAALVAGASTALDVDLAAPALAVAQRNAAINGVADRHRIQRGDCATILEDQSEPFDCIICDPPTAAAGGKGWVVRRDYPGLLRLLHRRLAPHGLLLAACNTLGKPWDLGRGLREAGFAALPDDEQPRLAADLPQRRGFPEGRPFRLLAARKAG